MNVIKLAQEAGMRWEGGFTRVIECVTEAELTRFAALVRAAALEEAAGACEDLDEDTCWKGGRLASGYKCAAAIRAMKEQT